MTSQTGRNDSGTDPFGPNRNELLVDLQSLRHLDPRPDEGRARRGAVAAAPAPTSRASRSTSPSRSSTPRPRSPPAPPRISRSSSADPTSATLRDARAADARRAAAACRGAADTSIEQEADQAQLRIVIDRLQVARYGINVSDVQDVIDLALGGEPDHGGLRGRPPLRRGRALRAGGAGRPGRHRRPADPDPRRRRGFRCRSSPTSGCRTARPSSPGGRISGRSRCARTSGVATRAGSSRRPRRGSREAVKLPPGLHGWTGAASSRTSSGRASGWRSSSRSRSGSSSSCCSSRSGRRFDAALVLVNVPFSLAGGPGRRSTFAASI